MCISNSDSDEIVCLGTRWRTERKEVAPSSRDVKNVRRYSANSADVDRSSTTVISRYMVDRNGIKPKNAGISWAKVAACKRKLDVNTASSLFVLPDGYAWGDIASVSSSPGSKKQRQH